MGKGRTRIGAGLRALLALLPALLLPAAALAEPAPWASTPAEKAAVSPGGVDMRTGRYFHAETDLSIGDLTLARSMNPDVPGHARPFGNFSHNLEIFLFEKRVSRYERNFRHGAGGDYRIVVHLGGLADTFDSDFDPGSGFEQVSQGPGALLSHDGAKDGAALYTYRTSDGTEYVFRPIGRADCSGLYRCAFVDHILKPDGTRHDFRYSGSNLVGVTSSRGYALLLENGGQISRACALNLSVIAMPPDNLCPAGAQAMVSYAYVQNNGTRLTAITGPDGETRRFTYGMTDGAVTMGFVRPGPSATPWVVHRLGSAYDPDGHSYETVVRQDYADGRSFAYEFALSTAGDPLFPTIAGGTFTDALGHATRVDYGFHSLPGTGPGTIWCRPPACTNPDPDTDTQSRPIQQTSGPVRIVDPLGRTIAGDYCEPPPDSDLPIQDLQNCFVGALQSFTDPGGIETFLTYGPFRNVIEAVRRARSEPDGSASLPDIVNRASYEFCIESGYRFCDRPSTTTDPEGRVTRYTFDPVHGGVRTETGPAVPTRRADGSFADVAPQKRFDWERRSPWLKNPAGGYVQGPPVWLLARESFCRTSAATGDAASPCTAPGDEVVTAYDYGPDSGPNTLLLRGTAVTADGQTLRTCYAWDDRGNRISETAPAGTVGFGSCPAGPPATALPYTTSYRYDAEGRQTGIISPDPDGAGPLRLPAVRSSYSPAGDLQTVEHGDLAAWQPASVAPKDWAGFTRHRRLDYVHDASGRKTVEVATALGAVRSATHFKYDRAGRLLCTAKRMDPATWLPPPPAPPPDACLPTSATPGSFGPDRITRNEYDAAGQLVQVREAVGTPDESATTYSYTANGKRALVIDGRGNRAELRYDGQDRLARWVFPSETPSAGFNDADAASATQTAGALNEGDHERYEYDLAGNRVRFRKRDGSELTFSYDALNRMRVKIVPERADLLPTHTRDVHYAYDLRGLQTEARFDGTNGEGVVNAFDAFGRLASSTNSLGGTVRRLEYAWNPGGTRRELRWPDGVAMSFTYDGLDRMTGIGRDPSASAVPVATLAYDNKGQRVSLSRAAGDSTSYAYDGLGRLATLTDTFVGGAGNSTSTFAHNPASQIVSLSRSNDAYAWTGHTNVERPYATNGLNQYDTAGAPGAETKFEYDPNGNLTKSVSPAPTAATRNYLYDVENRLVRASGASNANLAYDPLGRLFETSGGSAGARRFLYDGDELVAEYDGATGALLRRYVHGAGVDDPLIWYEGPTLGIPRFLHSDHQGSITAIADGSGGILQINAYDEYGIPMPTNLGRFQYTGQAWIPELEMYHYKARIYSPTLGRFLQTDPIGYEDQTNLYAYVGDDPVNASDPSGEFGILKWGLKIIVKGGNVAAASVGIVEDVRTITSSTSTLGERARAVGSLATELLSPVSARDARTINRTLSPGRRCCFVAGTLVETESGLRPIEEIAVGDKVWSRNIRTGATALKPVTDVIRRHHRVIWEVVISRSDGRTEKFQTTDDHPWWIPARGWIETANLTPGMQGVTRDGRSIVISSVKETDRTTSTYNLSVAEFETYFVGNLQVLVHNCPTGAYTNTHRSGRTYDGKGNSDRARRSGREVGRANADPVASTKTYQARTDRESFIIESRNLDANGGPRSSSNYNRIESPGKRYRREDGVD